MKRAQSYLVVALTAALWTAGLQPAEAGERGKFMGHAVLEVTKFTEYKAPEGHPYKAAISGELDGLIFHNGGGTKLDKMLDHTTTSSSSLAMRGPVRPTA